MPRSVTLTCQVAAMNAEKMALKTDVTQSAIDD
jgi:hypothetical protein